jgi:hypothetical protein
MKTMRNRNKRIWTRLNDDEYTRFKKHVEHSGLSQETYLRFLIENLVPKSKPPSDYFAMTRELRAIGNNIHQLATKANALHLIDADGFKQYSDMLNRQISAIQDVVEIPEKRK